MVKNQQKYAIGIDLGTTYSCVAVYRNDHVEIIQNSHGNKTTPSIVSFTKKEIFVGESAKDQMSINSENTLFDIKRLIGRKYSDKLVREDIKVWPFSVVKNNYDRPDMQVTFRKEVTIFTPEQISSFILYNLKKDAEKYLDCAVSDVVITVPAYFSDSQRESTKIAGEIAGFNVLRIINEPTAAAIAYGFDNDNKTDSNILVFDFGGGTFDISIINVKQKEIKVLATDGDTHLGGSDFDAEIIKYVVDEVKRKYRVNLSTNSRDYAKLKFKCEFAKRTLSNATEAVITLDQEIDGQAISVKLSRSKFESLCKKLFDRLFAPLQKALDNAELDKEDIEDIVLVGGSSRIPYIKEKLTQIFSSSKIKQNINPDEAVAYGAALQAAKISGYDCDSIQKLSISDITPLSLGIETIGEKMCVLIKKGTRIPVSISDIFTTTFDDQTTLNNKIFEGEDESTKNNNYLGSFNLTNIPPMRKGKPKITTTITVDENGILGVSSKIEASGRIQAIQIIRDEARLNQRAIENCVKNTREVVQGSEDYKALKEKISHLEVYLNQILSELDENIWHNNIDKELVGLKRECDEILEEISNEEIDSLEDINFKKDMVESKLMRCLKNTEDLSRFQNF
uniref:Heat shock protein 70 n=1 Tax=Rhabditophanes sp. KR3021 TaxID=114890 RepID=A0AC35TW78_9BILA